MAVQTTALKNSLATAYGTNTTSVALFTTVPGASAGTEVTGTGYARQTITWGAPTNGVITGTVTFTVPAGVTIAGAGFYSSGGVYQDGGAVTSQNFATSGQYALTVSATVS